MDTRILTLDEFPDIKRSILSELELEYADDAPVDEKVVLSKINSMIDETFYDVDLLSDIVGEFDKNIKSGELKDASLEPLGMLLDRLITIIGRVRQPVYTVCDVYFINNTGDFIIKLKRSYHDKHE